MGFLRKKVSPELTIQRNWCYKIQVFKVAKKARKDKTQNRVKGRKTNSLAMTIVTISTQIQYSRFMRALARKIGDMIRDQVRILYLYYFYDTYISMYVY